MWDWVWRWCQSAHQCFLANEPGLKEKILGLKTKSKPDSECMLSFVAAANRIARPEGNMQPLFLVPSPSSSPPLTVVFKLIFFPAKISVQLSCSLFHFLKCKETLKGKKNRRGVDDQKIFEVDIFLRIFFSTKKKRHCNRRSFFFFFLSLQEKRATLSGRCGSWFFLLNFFRQINFACYPH